MGIELSPILVSAHAVGRPLAERRGRPARPCWCTSRAAPRSTSGSTASPATPTSTPPTSPAVPVRATGLTPPPTQERPVPTMPPRPRPTCPLDELMAAARAVRDRRPRHPGHLLAQGVHPAHDAVPRPLRLLHLRPAAGPARRRPYLDARRGAGHRPRRRRGRAATRRCSPSARRPRSATPPPPSGSPTTATPRTVDYLVAPCAGSCSTRPACSPTPTPAPSPPTSWPRSGPCRPSPGDDDRVAPRRPRLPPRRARQDARAPPRHARGRRRAGASRSPPASSSASARPGRPDRRAGGHRGVAPRATATCRR